MKKSLTIGIVVGVIVTFSVSVFVYFKNIKENEVGSDIYIREENENTKVYGVLNTPMEKNNMLWCGTFQMAWNELRDNIIKEDIKLNGEEQLSSELNKKTFTKENINKNSYLAMVGYNKQGIVEKVNKGLKDKFGEDGKWKVESKLQRPDDILAYAFLKKKLDFQYSFEKIEDSLEFNGTSVKGFGISDINNSKSRKRLSEQVKVLYYDNENDFIISLKGMDANDELILAKIPEKDTLNNTLDYALSKSGVEMSFSPNGILKVPELGVDIKKNFKELENKNLINNNFQDYQITQAIQRIKFSLTENGAKLESKTEINATKSEEGFKEPKNLIFDKPFLLYMKEKGDKKPYFVMWVENTEFMISN